MSKHFSAKYHQEKILQKIYCARKKNLSKEEK